MRHRCSSSLAAVVISSAASLLALSGLLWRTSPEAFAAPKVVPTSRELMQALGRELWLASDELLEAAASFEQLNFVGLGAISMRNAADSMLEGNWEDTMALLEETAAAFDNEIPSVYFTGLVNLFAYVEPVPQCEWGNARSSLKTISSLMWGACYRKISGGQMIPEGVPGAKREKAVRSLEFAIEVLKKAQLLFDPATFYMPADPRIAGAKQGKGHARQNEYQETARWVEMQNGREPSPSGGYRPQEVVPEVVPSAYDLMKARLRQEAVDAAARAGKIQEVNTLLLQVDADLGDADGNERRARLRKLLREYHPDQNPGREAEVRPVFQYVNKLREAVRQPDNW
eukprot:TRINITY_DN22436_c0_g1_i1.p1 TRINITY_DN22436_c0_g1~~TRINITY_DN22436_c0_g1_i1.p1  ORF type:complete len:366 (-),score=87.77 TRINITY_DN22436_c0_g1_i1:79-1107(-)